MDDFQQPSPFSKSQASPPPSSHHQIVKNLKEASLPQLSHTPSVQWEAKAVWDLPSLGYLALIVPNPSQGPEK